MPINMRGADYVLQVSDPPNMVPTRNHVGPLAPRHFAGAKLHLLKRPPMRLEAAHAVAKHIAAKLGAAVFAVVAHGQREGAVDWAVYPALGSDAEPTFKTVRRYGVAPDGRLERVAPGPKRVSSWTAGLPRRGRYLVAWETGPDDQFVSEEITSAAASTRCRSAPEGARPTVWLLLKKPPADSADAYWPTKKAFHYDGLEFHSGWQGTGLAANHPAKAYLMAAMLAPARTTFALAFEGQTEHTYGLLPAIVRAYGICRAAQCRVYATHRTKLGDPSATWYVDLSTNQRPKLYAFGM